jgi:tripartite-type tricarboxylate transporter receptor subunit TctC
LALSLAATGALAQSFPSQPVRIVVPFPPGGSADVLARILQPKLNELWRQPVLVENKPGASANIGADHVAKSAPDGTTMLLATPALAVSAAVYKNLPYEAQRDLAPVAMLSVFPSVLVVHPSVPAKTPAELVQYAKANPGKLNFGFGQGTLPQLVGEMFKAAAGIDITSVPYSGGAQAVTDLLGGRIDMNIGTTSTLLPLHRTGKVRMIAYTGTARRPDMPDIPTMIESGYPSVVSTTYYGILGRADLPPEIVTSLNAAVNEIVKLPEVKDSMAKVGFEPKAFTPRELATLFAGETEKWIAIVRATGFQM